MKANELTPRHELLMPDGTWCRVRGVRRYGSVLFVELAPCGFSVRGLRENVDARIPEER